MFYPSPYHDGEPLHDQHFIEMHPSEPIVIGYGRIEGKGRRLVVTLKYDSVHGKPINAAKKVDILCMPHILLFETRDSMLTALAQFGIALPVKATPKEEPIEELILQIRQQLEDAHRQLDKQSVACPRCKDFNFYGCTLCDGTSRVTRDLAYSYEKFFGRNKPEYGEGKRIENFLEYYHNEKNKKPNTVKSQQSVPCPRCADLWSTNGCTLCDRGKVTSHLADAYDQYFKGDFPQSGDTARMNEFFRWYRHTYSKKNPKN